MIIYSFLVKDAAEYTGLLNFLASAISLVSAIVGITIILWLFIIVVKHFINKEKSFGFMIFWGAMFILMNIFAMYPYYIFIQRQELKNQ